jgi:hypothetical protein
VTVRVPAAYSPTVRRFWRVVVTLGAVTVCVSSAGAARSALGVLPRPVPPFPFAKLLAASRSMGEPAPSSAVWVAASHRAAVAVTMGDTVRGNEPVYVAVLTGHFRDDAASPPRGAKAPTGTVATFVYDARTGLERDFGLSRDQPDLGKLGNVHDFLPYLRQASAGTATTKGAPTDVPASIETQWLERLSAGSRLGCHTRFHNAPVATFRTRLDRTAARDGFTVEHVQFLRACQLAPIVALSTSDPRRLVALLPALEKDLDRVTVKGQTVWAYEGFLLEGSDGSGRPFVVIWNHVRGEVAGGQWAASPDLYPFPHG